MAAAPNKKAWNYIISHAQARSAAKSRETELVATRKDLENQLDALGPGNTTDHLRVSRDYVLTLRSIEYERARIKTLADDMERAINSSLQGKFDFAEDSVEIRELVRPPSEGELFQAPPPPKPKDDRPVGVKPEEPVPVGENQHLASSINELDVREDIKGKLIAAGVTTMAGLFARLEHDDISGTGISELANITPELAKSVVAAAKKWQKAQRKAAIEVEKEGAIL